MIKLFGKAINVRKASHDKKTLDIGANLFIGNLDPDVDEKLLYDTFSAFGVIMGNPKIMRDPDSGNTRGFGFISYDSFDASDSAIETMNGQYLCNRQITVSYAYKKDSKGERHGTPAERVLAASNSSTQKNRPHTMFAAGPSTLPRANGTGPSSVPPPRPFANGTIPQPSMQMFPPPAQVSMFTPMSAPPSWPGQQPGYQPMPPPPNMQQFRPQPPPPPAGMGGLPQYWRPPPSPGQHFQGHIPPPMQHMGMQQPPPPPPPATS